MAYMDPMGDSSYMKFLSCIISKSQSQLRNLRTANRSRWGETAAFFHGGFLRRKALENGDITNKKGNLAGFTMIDFSWVNVIDWYKLGFMVYIYIRTICHGVFFNQRTLHGIHSDSTVCQKPARHLGIWQHAARLFSIKCWSLPVVFYETIKSTPRGGS